MRNFDVLFVFPLYDNKNVVVLNNKESNENDIIQTFFFDTDKTRESYERRKMREN